MKLNILLILLLNTIHFGICYEKDVTKLEIEVLDKPNVCNKKAKNGDNISVHYTGMLTDGSVFDSSYKRDSPINFILGSGRVIQGWEKGLLGACIGEKRKLKIPPDMGYGHLGYPPKIPGDATLIFEIEVVNF